MDAAVGRGARTSADYAAAFAQQAAQTCPAPPERDEFPDGRAALTWRSRRGILNVAFGEDGLATYAAYLPHEAATHKGRWRVSAAVPALIAQLLQAIMQGQGGERV